MHPYVQASLRAFFGGILLALYHAFITGLNPFLGSVALFLALLAIGAYLFSLRKKGMLYVGVFLVSLTVFTSLFVALDNGFFEHSRRYYAVE
ncbi:hypothetical protein FAES_4622 [Fibrella aestuarina BUZ 2]|uniref:Uncharacterized protein n=1 Tax=Fibrella aestuarina BUZ 2 TaxID=1166018 RepID=I0KER8_9BACT|nr:hypothetical protein [Fibrella aestuarina]CCH02621.1 hypothetical protein FAES_4622 [Fibrella aestuarina BUZ 2]